MGIAGKAFRPICGRPMVAWSLDVFQRLDEIDEIIVVAGRHTIDDAREIQGSCSWTKLKSVIVGGKTRFDSVGIGVQASTPNSKWVVLHDAARPFVDPDIVKRCFDRAAECGAAIATTPIVDSVKAIDGVLITHSLPRETLRAAQTPQIFKRGQLLEAIAKSPLPADQITDEATLYEALGIPVGISEGTRANWKLTVPEDIEPAEFQMKQRLSETGQQ